MFKKGDKKVMNAWAMYDWANSAYPLVITTAIFPLYYGAVVDDVVEMFGASFSRVEIYSYTIALSHILIALISPILSGVADYSKNKKIFMKIFNYIGALACMALCFFESVSLLGGLAMVFFANVGFWGSLVYYNAYLPEIADVEDQDKLSAKGFSMGYIGSAILLIIGLAMVMTADDSDKILMMRYTFLLTGIWWIGFAQYSYKYLPKNATGELPVKKDLFTKGFKELRGVWNEFKNITRLKRFLMSFFVYSMAVQTIMTMAQFFGTDAITWPSKEIMQTGMIVSILVIQLIAIPGAMLFARLSGKWGNIKVLSWALIIWIFICASAYFIDTPNEFYTLAAVVGFVMGGIQALSRSTYSKLLPETQDHASYFSFYDVLEKIGVAIGIISFGYIEGTYSIRYSVMALMVFFIIGLVLLFLVPKKQEN